MKLNIVAACQGYKRFQWEVQIYLNSLRERGLSDKATILVFIPYSTLKRNLQGEWTQLIADFPEAKIEFFRDDENFEKLHNTFGYIPLIRPHMLAKWYADNPYLKDEAVFYTDTDVLITKDIPWETYLADNICYMSDAAGYTNHVYFDSKRRKNSDGTPEFVQASKYEAFMKRDILNECAAYCGIDREVIERNWNSSGAAQYLLKGIDSQFWLDVLDACINIKAHLGAVNQEYMLGSNAGERENTGFQSWCADIHATVWLLWNRGLPTITPPELDFCWATDTIDRWDKTSIFHNAGVTAESTIRTRAKNADGTNVFVDAPVFYKGKGQYANNTLTPFQDDEYIQNIINHPISKQYCSYKYAEEIVKTKKAFNL